MFWRKKHLHGLDAIARHFKINSMDLMTWHRSRADPPPMWRCEQSVWHCDVKSMKRWLKENGLMPKRVSLLEILKNEREHRHERRKIRNQINRNREVNKAQSRDWQITDDHLRRKRLW
jgi:hypothetical protein